jgi:probable DNA repair protein
MNSRYEWLERALVNNGVVVTANRRLSRELHRVHGELQIVAGRKAWPTPKIQFVTDWVAQLVESGSAVTSQPVRIGAQASSILWERCVRDALKEQLPGISGIARQYKQAWSRLQEWCVPASEVIARATSAEQKQFAVALHQYGETLASNNWIDDAALVGAATGHVDASGDCANAPQELCLAGFDRVSPALELLLQTLAGKGTKHLFAESRDIAAAISTDVFGDQAAELRAAGAWAREKLLADPTQRIAIICPDLESNAARISSYVREGFVPGWQLAGEAHRHAVDISYGRPLSEYPAIKVALMLLRWVHDGMSSRDISVLLRSRSIVGGPTGGRSRLELRLRGIPDRNWQVSDLLQALKAPRGDEDAEAWHQSIGKIAAARQHYREVAGSAAWAERFDSLLSGAGWPGSDAQDSHEFQLINRWRDLLNEFAQLEPLMQAISFQQAAAKLAQLAGDTLFQPESDAAILPVLGTLEAAGMEFDRIWVSSFDDRHWPAPGNPLTAVSRQLQKDHDMPDATTQDTLSFSRRVIDRLLHSAPDVVLGWAASDGDVPLDPSPLLRDLSETKPGEKRDPGWFAQTVLNDEKVVNCASDPVPPVAVNERIRGGAYTVQRQATDPFSAFAFGRLRVSDLLHFQPGLSPMIRGNAIHNALSDLLGHHPSQSDMQSRSDDEWAGHAAAAARRSLVRYERHADDALRQIIQLEHRRIEQILTRFVAAESSRENFQVMMTEQELEFVGHGVQLGLRVDRVDLMDDGSITIIDYKTGTEKAPANRAGDINDLQLVVYALALQAEHAIGGIVIINLDTRKISYKPGSQPDNWAASYSRWSAEAVETIAALSRGGADVNASLSTDQARTLNVLSRFEELRRD